MKKILSAGTIVELSADPVTLPITDLAAAALAVTAWDDISCALTGLSTESTEREQIDITSLCDTYSKSYIDGLKDQDTASSDAFFNPASEEGIALQAAADSEGTYILRETLVNGTTILTLARLQPFGHTTTVGDTIKTTLNFKLSGKPVIKNPTV